MDTAVSKPYRSSGTRAKWAMALVGIASAAVAILALVAASGISLVQNIETTTTLSEIEGWERTINQATGFYGLAVVAAAVAFLAWLHRAVANVPALGGGKTTSSPWGAVGWWFVPIANFFRPYQIVADLWRRTAGPAEQGRTLVLAWWLLWIGGSLVDRLLGVMNPESIDALVGALAVEVLALAAVAIAGGLLVRIIWEVERRSRLRAAASVASPGSTPAATTDDPAVPSGASLAQPTASEAPTERGSGPS